MTVVPLESEEAISSDSSISSCTRGSRSSDKEIKQSRKKDKGMYREMLVLVSFERI